VNSKLRIALEKLGARGVWCIHIDIQTHLEGERGRAKERINPPLSLENKKKKKKKEEKERARKWINK
jgi:hypothetical protein